MWWRLYRIRNERIIGNLKVTEKGQENKREKLRRFMDMLEGEITRPDVQED